MLEDCGSVPVSTNVACIACGHCCNMQDNTRFIIGGFSILGCPACKVLFRPVDRDTWDAKELYGDDYYRSDNAALYAEYSSEEHAHRKTGRQRLKKITTMLASGRRRLLDVGCAAGFFLDEAKKSGWNVLGVDVSQAMSRFAQEHFGLEVICSDFQRVSLGERQFDAISLWDYIEHSPDPFGDLSKARSLLTKGGVLALTTGDIGSLFARLSGARWHLLAPRYHLTYFTPSTISALLRRAGFSDIRISHDRSNHTVSHLTHKLRTVHDGPLIRNLSTRISRSRIGRCSIPINAGDIMTVYARA